MTPARLAILLLTAALLAGCESKSENPFQVVPGATTRTAWIGAYAGGTPGDVAMDLTRQSFEITGELVMSAGDAHLFVRGSFNGDSIFLALDPAHHTNTSGFSLRARAAVNGTLSGRIVFASQGIDAPMTGRQLPRRRIVGDVVTSVPHSVIAIAWDGSLLWMSTTGHDYVRMTPGGVIADTIAVFRSPGVHWTSSVLMYDGARLWGVYPISISVGPGVVVNVADLLDFTAAGRGSDSIRVAHRPGGLAHDGTHGWSLRSAPRALIGYDATGATTDSLHVGVPDAYGVAHDGTHFWVVGWSMRRLYEVDAAGEIVAICDLPSVSTSSFSAGIVFEGAHVWYAESVIGGTTLHRMSLE